jgi:hypothetical protein
VSDRRTTDAIPHFDGTRTHPMEWLFLPCITVEEWWHNR